MDSRRLLQELSDPDEEARAAALDALLPEMDDEIATALLEIATSDAAEVARADAAIALGPVIEECGDDYAEDAIDLGPELGPPVSRETFASIEKRLRGLYSDEAQPKLVRRRAFESLVRNPQAWQRDAIRKHFVSADDDWQMTAVFAMGHMTGFEREIAAAVETAKGTLLAEAVIAAGRMGVNAAASRIRELAASPRTKLDLRIAAIQALPHVDPDCFELLETLEGSRSMDIAEAAGEALEELSIFGQYDEDDDEDDDELT